MVLMGLGLCSAAIILMLAFPAVAQQGKKEILREQINPKTGDAEDPWFGGNWQLGAIGKVGTSPYRSADTTKFGALPLVAYDAERMHIGTDGIDVKVFRNQYFSASILGSIRSKPYDSGDGDYLRGMDDRDMAFEAGAGFSARIWRGSLVAHHLFDVSGTHDGQEIDLSYFLPMQWGDVNFKWGGGVTWQSDKLVDHMAGVRRTEVRADRNYYAPDAAFIPHLDLTVTYPVTERFSLIGTGGFQYLPDQYTDSPIIDEDYVLSAGLGLVYTF